MNDAARLITLAEGGKRNCTIADVKEVCRRIRELCLSNGEFDMAFDNYCASRKDELKDKRAGIKKARARK